MRRTVRQTLTTFLLVATLMPAVTCTAPAQTPGERAPSASANQVPQLRRDDRWLVDEHGRVVLIHGMNLVWKHKPYAPPDSPEGFTAADARWLADHGFNGARIGTLWAGVSPTQPDTVDQDYLNQWDRVVKQLAGSRIWTQFDFHQDQWNEIYAGEGVPDWAVHRPQPFNLLPPPRAPFPGNYTSPEVSTVYDNFWANKDGLLDNWANAWKAVAEHYRNQPYSMGYDLFNEPWPGNEWGACMINGCPDSYPKELQPAFDRAREAIRQADPNNITWYEPLGMTSGRDVPSNFGPVAGENQLGYSWHNYCPQVFFASHGVPADMSQCAGFSEERNQSAQDQEKRMDAVGLMSEFGATDQTQALTIDADTADKHFTSWMHWAYKNWHDPTTADQAQGLFRDDADLSSAKPDKLRALVRTYPQATAGTPLELSFNASNGDFHYRYQPEKLDAATEIFVSPLHYPGGYDITVSGGHVTDHLPNNRIAIAADGTTPVTVTIHGR